MLRHFFSASSEPTAMVFYPPHVCCSGLSPLPGQSQNSPGPEGCQDWRGSVQTRCRHQGKWWDEIFNTIENRNVQLFEDQWQLLSVRILYAGGPRNAGEGFSPVREWDRDGESSEGLWAEEGSLRCGGQHQEGGVRNGLSAAGTVTRSSSVHEVCAPPLLG